MSAEPKKRFDDNREELHAIAKEFAEKVKDNPGALHHVDNYGGPHVRNEGDTVMAELNWWEECLPNPVHIHGDVDYDPWLCAPPEMPTVVVYWRKSPLKIQKSK